MNRSGQAMIEALIAGLICFLSLWYILILGFKIISTNQQAEVNEENTITVQRF